MSVAAVAPLSSELAGSVEQLQQPRVTARKDLKALTGLRFFSALAVVVYHARDCYGTWNSELECIVSPHVVTFFFVLSGFILTINYQNLKDARSILLFYLARIGRIWPAHAITLCLLVTLVPETFKVTAANLKTFLLNLFMLHAWVPDWNCYFSFNSPAWSNSTECFFYLCFPLLLVALKKKWYYAVAPTALCLIALVIYCNSMHLVEFTNGPCNQAFVYINPLSRILEFTIGMVAGKIFAEQVQHMKIGTIAATAIEIAVMSLFFLFSNYRLAVRSVCQPFLGEAGAFWFHNSGLPVLVVAAMFMILSMERGLLARVLGIPLLVFLGDISFGAYMLHCVLLTYRNINFPFASSPIDCCLFFAILVLGTHLMSATLERPMRTIILSAGKLLKPPKTVSAAEPEAFKAIKAKKPPASIKQKLLLAGEVLTLAILCYFAVPAIQPISASNASLLDRSATVHDVEFQNHVKLRSAEASKCGNKIIVTLVWEALRDQRVNYLEIHEVHDSSGKLLTFGSHAQDLRLTHVLKGSMWSEKFELSSGGNLSNAASISLRLIKDKKKPLWCKTQENSQAPEVSVPCKDQS